MIVIYFFAILAALNKFPELKLTWKSGTTEFKFDPVGVIGYAALIITAWKIAEFLTRTI